MKNIVIVLLFLSVGFGAGYFLSGGGKIEQMDMGTDSDMMMDMSADSMTHMHSMLEVDSAAPTPAVSLEALKDTKDGYNLHITPENFVFTPEKVNEDPVQGEGHAHIYVNDVKFARLYSDWFNLPSSALSEGENVIEVTLNANDHSEWTLEGQHISASVTVFNE